jgi:hypothetical protein
VFIPELKIFLIEALLMVFFTLLLKQDIRRNVLVFLLACAFGYLAQAALGRELNRYTPNIRIYFGYVSLAVILTWGVGLSAIHAMHRWVAGRLGRKPGLGIYYACGVPIIMILEFTGSNIVHMKLHDFRRYIPLMGSSLNAMHAPAWLYAYYILAATLFYFAVRAMPWSIARGEAHAVVARMPVRGEAGAD